jgi:hypothetical protein
LRHIEFLGGEITGLDRRIAQQALARSPDSSGC